MIQRHILSLLVVVSLVTGLALAQPPKETPKESTKDTPKDSPKEPAEKPAPNLRPKAPIPVPPEKLESAIRRGVEFLIQTQNKDGSWGSPSLKGGVEIYAGIGTLKSYGTASTALVVSALIETGGDAPVVIKAIERGEQSLFETLPQEKRDDPTLLNNIWAHAYGIQALVRMHGRLPDDKPRREKIEKLIRQQLERLTKYESMEGGWGYYDFEAGTQRPASNSTSFMNATVLVAMHEAKSIGIDPPERVLKRGIKMTQFQRQRDGTYLYGTYLWSRPTMGINRAAGSLGRSPACNLALRMWGDPKITDDVLKEWLDKLISRNGWLSLGRKKPVPHESFFQVAGYFYYFGHYYATATIPILPEKDREFYQDHFATILMDLQEGDGSWFDYPLYNYHKPYGTGFALLSLAACKKKAGK